MSCGELAVNQPTDCGFEFCFCDDCLCDLNPTDLVAIMEVHHKKRHPKCFEETTWTSMPTSPLKPRAS
jgi:hypothetical protein